MCFIHLQLPSFINFRDDTNRARLWHWWWFSRHSFGNNVSQCKLQNDRWYRQKIKVATEIANAIGLENVLLQHKRGEEEKGKFDFIVSRAVMPLPDMMKIVRKNIAKDNHNVVENGVIVLKGGTLDEELKPYKR